MCVVYAACGVLRVACVLHVASVHLHAHVPVCGRCVCTCGARTCLSVWLSVCAFSSYSSTGLTSTHRPTHTHPHMHTHPRARAHTRAHPRAHPHHNPSGMLTGIILTKRLGTSRATCRITSAHLILATRGSRKALAPLNVRRQWTGLRHSHARDLGSATLACSPWARVRGPRRPRTRRTAALWWWPARHGNYTQGL